MLKRDKELQGFKPLEKMNASLTTLHVTPDVKAIRWRSHRTVFLHVVFLMGSVL